MDRLKVFRCRPLAEERAGNIPERLKGRRFGKCLVVGNRIPLETQVVA